MLEESSTKDYHYAKIINANKYFEAANVLQTGTVYHNIKGKRTTNVYSK